MTTYQREPPFGQVVFGQVIVEGVHQQIPPERIQTEMVADESAVS